MSLSKSKCWYPNNCLHFVKRAVPSVKYFCQDYMSGIDSNFFQEKTFKTFRGFFYWLKHSRKTLLFKQEKMFSLDIDINIDMDIDILEDSSK
jgi:hypothetical protein